MVSQKIPEISKQTTNPTGISQESKHFFEKHLMFFGS